MPAAWHTAKQNGGRGSAGVVTFLLPSPLPSATQVDANGVVLGYSHFGMLAAARWIKSQVKPQLEAALAANPGRAWAVRGRCT